MRVAVLSVADLRHMTCANFYCEYLTNKRIPFDIICMNRYKESASIIYDCKLYRYDSFYGTNASYLKKLFSFLHFKKYALNILNKNNYDFIIVWGENAGILFSDYLIKHKFCINIRDPLHSGNKFFDSILKQTMLNAKFVTTPSPEGFKYIVGNTYLLLNCDYQVIRCYKKALKLSKTTGIINIVYMGVIHSFIDKFKEFLLLFKNDQRFLISFYGKGADSDLCEFAKKNNINNAKFYGTFSPDKTAEILESTDIINSSHGDLVSCEGAVGVKEGYAPLLHIPVISDKGCYFANLSEKFGFGLGISYDKRIPDVIYDWYMSLNSNDFDKGCEKYTLWLNKSNQKVLELLNSYLINNVS